MIKMKLETLIAIYGKPLIVALIVIGLFYGVLNIYLNQPQNVKYNVTVNIELSKNLNNKEEKSLIRIGVYKPEEKITCKNESPIALEPWVRCATVLLRGDKKEYNLQGSGTDYAYWLTENIDEGNYKLLIDIESDGIMDGEFDIPIRRRVELISPAEKQRFPDFNFDLTWNEDEKEKLDRLSTNIHEHRYYVEIGTDIDDYPILKETNIHVTKNITGLVDLRFTSNYISIEPKDTGKVNFQEVFVTEKTTRKIILGNYTRYKGPPSDKDWD